MKKFLVFEVVGSSRSGKTVVVEVRAASDNTLLGVIKWWAPWRQYCFFPESDTVWSRGCNQAVNSYIDDLMEQRQQ